MEIIKDEVYQTDGGVLHFADEVHETHAVLTTLFGRREVVFYDEEEKLERFRLADLSRIIEITEAVDNRIVEKEIDLAQLKLQRGMLTDLATIAQNRKDI